MKRNNTAEDLLYSSIETQATKYKKSKETKNKLDIVTPKEVVCYNCGSKNYHKRGKTKRGGQRYNCKNCKKGFAINSLVDKNGIEIKCPDCNSRNYTFNSKSKTLNKDIYKCQDCNRQYILNSDNLDWYNRINCRWCKSKSFTSCR